MEKLKGNLYKIGGVFIVINIILTINLLIKNGEQNKKYNQLLEKTESLINQPPQVYTTTNDSRAKTSVVNIGDNKIAIVEDTGLVEIFKYDDAKQKYIKVQVDY